MASGSYLGILCPVQEHKMYFCLFFIIFVKCFVFSYGFLTYTGVKLMLVLSSTFSILKEQDIMNVYKSCDTWSVFLYIYTFS